MSLMDSSDMTEQDVWTELDQMRCEKIRLKCRYEEMEETFEKLIYRNFWLKQDFAFYLKEFTHTMVCKHTERVEPPVLIGEHDAMYKLDNICEEILNSMDAIYECLDVKTADLDRVGKMIDVVINDQNVNIFTCNQEHDMLLSRCSEKKYLEDPESNVTNNEVLNIIEHVIVFSTKSITNVPPMYFKDAEINEKVMRIHLVKDLSASSFYKIRDYLNANVFTHPPNITNMLKPYIRTRNIHYTPDQLKYIRKVLRKENVVISPRPRVTEPRKSGNQSCVFVPIPDLEAGIAAVEIRFD